MPVFDDVRRVLAQYAGGSAPSGAVEDHFNQVARAVDPSTLRDAVATAIRSDQTPSFAQGAGQLFAAASAPQKTSMLNTLIAALGSQHVGQLSQWIPGFSPGVPITPDVATSVSPATVTAIAQHAEHHDESVIDKISAVYAAHPGLVQALGTAAMTVAMQSLANRRI